MFKELTSSCTGIRSKEVCKKNSYFATVIGSSSNVTEDIIKYGIRGDIIVTNHVGFYYPRNIPYDHLVSYHSDHFKINSLVRKHLKPDIKFHKYKTHTSGSVDSVVLRDRDYVDYVWKFTPKPKSSGMLACFIALSLGYTKIMLLGIPLDLSVRFHDIGMDVPKEKNYYNSMYKEMILDNSLVLLKGRARSASGNTAKILGKPTEEWFDGQRRIE